MALLKLDELEGPFQATPFHDCVRVFQLSLVEIPCGCSRLDPVIGSMVSMLGFSESRGTSKDPSTLLLLACRKPGMDLGHVSFLLHPTVGLWEKGRNPKPPGERSKLLRLPGAGNTSALDFFPWREL